MDATGYLGRFKRDLYQRLLVRIESTDGAESWLEMLYS